MNVHFDWYGYWDKTAYWAYGMWVFNIYDWAYLFGWYGLGWDALSPLNTPPSGKLEFYFYDDPNDAADGWSLGLTIKFNLAHMDDLDISSDAWVTQVLQQGSILAHESSHSILWAVESTTDFSDNGWLTESIAYFTGDSLWPWYNYNGSEWTAQYNYDDIRTNYHICVNAPGSGGFLTWSQAGNIYLTQIQTGGPQFDNAWWTFHACGYYLVGWLNFGHAWMMADFLFNIQAGDSISDAFYNVTGWTLSLTTNDYSINNLWDFYYTFYNYWWT